MNPLSQSHQVTSTNTATVSSLEPSKKRSQREPPSIGAFISSNDNNAQKKKLSADENAHKAYIPTSFRMPDEAQQQSGFLQNKPKLGADNKNRRTGSRENNGPISKYNNPPRGVGLPPTVPNHGGISSYTNRVRQDEKNSEQGNSLDFIANMIKRDILSSPKTSSNHERQSQQALIDHTNRTKGGMN